MKIAADLVFDVGDQQGILFSRQFLRQSELLLAFGFKKKADAQPQVPDMIATRGWAAVSLQAGEPDALRDEELKECAYAEIWQDRVRHWAIPPASVLCASPLAHNRLNAWGRARRRADERQIVEVWSEIWEI